MSDNYNEQWRKAFSMFFSSKVFRHLLPGMLAVSAYTALLVYVNHVLGEVIKVTSFIYSLVGIVLGLLLVFRTNTAYERWWEGRKLLGSLLNTSRNVALKLNSFIPDSHQLSKNLLGKLVAAYAFALKEHLRNGVKFEELHDLHHEIDMQQLHRAEHVPNRIADLMYRELNGLYQNKIITNEQLLLLDKQFEAFTDIIGGCERIKKTPIPTAYKVHLTKFIVLFILLLPFGFVHEMHYWAIPVVIIIFYAFVGLDFIASEIEDPFGNDDNDLPTDDICKAIKANVYEILDIHQVSMGEKIKV